jgi:predicted AlkP superfamily phosphohydrolase/phosphomutase
MMKKPRAFIFGIDGGDWSVMEPLLDQGLLPNFSAVRQRSAYASLSCTQPAHTAPGWASLLTGRYPGGHGVYQFYHTQDPAYRGRITTSSDFGVSTLFDWLGQEGWTCGVVNVPMTHPPRRLPGYEITWPLANTLRFSEPPTLLGDLARNGVSFRSDLACMYRGHVEYVYEALENIKARQRSLEYLLHNHPTDVVMMVFSEIDRICHHYWHFFDPCHPQAVQEAKEEFRSAIRDCYIALDEVLGAILALLPHDAAIVVVSDHGSGPGYDDLAVNRVLEEGGLLETGSRGTSLAGSGVASWFVADGREVAWERTKAYMPVPGSFGINVNLEGRQRLGTVRASDADRVLTDITQLLSELRSNRSKEPVFKAILRAEEAYPGPFQRSAPDLLLVPNDERVIVGGSITGPVWRASYQTGLHRFHGVWMQASQNAVPGMLATPLRIVDVAPTLFAELGVAIPANLDGRVREDALRAGSCRNLSVLQERSSNIPQESVMEDPVVTERLRAMGYL